MDEAFKLIELPLDRSTLSSQVNFDEERDVKLAFFKDQKMFMCLKNVVQRSTECAK
jgi:hypothetical protein